jgi:hypothetical protein
VGDPKRNEAFAKLIFREFPNCKTCLVVADGKGHLAALLAKKYRVRVIENKPRQVLTRKRVKYQSGWFEASTPLTEDLIVGMHPDDATAPIIKAAVRNKKKWAVVPCCIMGLEAHGVSGFTAWIKKLRSFAPNSRTETLPIGGKSLVLWGKPG